MEYFYIFCWQNFGSLFSLNTRLRDIHPLQGKKINDNILIKMKVVKKILLFRCKVFVTYTPITPTGDMRRFTKKKKMPSANCLYPSSSDKQTAFQHLGISRQLSRVAWTSCQRTWHWLRAPPQCEGSGCTWPSAQSGREHQSWSGRCTDQQRDQQWSSPQSHQTLGWEKMYWNRL